MKRFYRSSTPLRHFGHFGHFVISAISDLVSLVDYAELAPLPALAPLVRCVWTLRGEHGGPAPAEANPAYPDGSPELIFNFGAPFEQVLPDGRGVLQPMAFLVGQISRPMVVRPTGVIDLVAVRFEGHGASVLHRPMRALTDQWRSIENLGDRQLADALTRAHTEARALPSTDARIEHLSAALAGFSQAATPPDSIVGEAVGAIRQSHGMVRLDELAGRLGVTTRSLQRYFGEQVGITPKLLARIVRFQRVFAAVQHEPSALSQVALACGYYDQSHLVRDFQDFAGDAPTRALTEMPEFTAFFTALRAST